MSSSSHGLSRSEPRSSRLDRLFPQGVPGLWCSMLTHYTPQGEIDWPRMEAHLSFMRQYVKGFVIAGHVGDGELLNTAQRQSLVDWIASKLKPNKEFFMAGVHVKDAESLNATTQWAAALKDKMTADPASFTGLWVHAAAKEVQPLLDLNLPVAIEVDHNSESSADAQAIATFAQSNENMLYAGDDSQDDAIARCATLPAGVFRFRSAEGDYTRQLGSSGGPYHGLYLASANLFPEQLAQIVLAPALGKWDESRDLSAKLTSFFKDAVALEKKTFHDNNATTRLCKAVDHHMAHGASANAAPMPMLGDVQLLAASFVNAMGDLLARHALSPQAGYLA